MSHLYGVYDVICLFLRRVMWLETDVATIRGAWYFNDDDICHNDVKDILRNLSVRRSHRVKVVQVIPLEQLPQQHPSTDMLPDVQIVDNDALPHQPAVYTGDGSTGKDHHQPEEEEQTTTCGACGVVLPYGPQCFPCIAL